MLILTIRTDNPTAEIGLYDGYLQGDYYTWLANRELAESIHIQIKELLLRNNKSLDMLDGIAVYKGPGSFTGLRIGISVANAFSDSLKIPIIGIAGEGWLDQSVKKIVTGNSDILVVPKYGAEPHITNPKR